MSSDLPPTGPKPMQPLGPTQRRQTRQTTRHNNRSREPIQAFSEAIQPVDEAVIDELLEADHDQPRAAHRQADPLIAYLIVIALGIGVSPLDALPRYVLLWSLMAFFGAGAYLLGELERVEDGNLGDLFWGMTFGFLASFPFLVVFGEALATISLRMFDVPNTPIIVLDTWVLMAVLFVIPLAETLFFRGGMQTVRSLPLTAVLSTLWSVVVFFPHMELNGREIIGLIMLIVFGLLNFMYAYIKFRNGLAAAWMAQVISYTMLWFLPRLFF